MEITLKAYAERLGKDPVIVRQKAQRGGFRTARKVGRDWVIDEDEPYVDKRKLKSAEVFNACADSLTAEERRRVLKWEQAKEYSGWRAYPDTCSAIFAQIPPEWADQYTAPQLGEIARLIKNVYDQGVAFGRSHPEE